MISLHILADNASPALLDRALLYLKRTKQRSVNIGAGAELLKGMQYVERVRAECPGIKIFWRNLDPEDTGIHTKMSPQALFDKKVAPHLNWFKKNEIILVCDNESSGDDNAIRRYAQWTVELLVIMHKHNLATAVCRFATGNIAEHQYQLLKPIFSAMLPSDWISPNEYSNEPGKSSGGHLERYKQMWIAAGKSLPTTIGEAGLCPGYDPGKGFRSIRMSGKDHAKQIVSEEIWYGNGTIDRFLYLVGGFGWEGFQLITEIGNGKVEADTLDALEAYYASKQPSTEPHMPTLPFVPVPADLSGIVELAIDNTAYPLQARPTNDPKESVGKLAIGERVKLYRSSHTSADGLIWHFCRRDSTPVGESVVGWCAYPMPLPDPVIVPPPPTNTMEVALKYIAALWAERQTCVARVAEIDTEMSEIAQIWTDAA